MRPAHSVVCVCGGGVHLKWIRGSYNKHSRKTIITLPLPQPGSAVPSRRSRQLKGAVEEMGMSYLRRKSTHGDSSDSPPPNTRLFTHNLMLQLVWRSYAVMSRSTSRCPLPRLPPLTSTLSLSLTLRSANKNVFVQINRRGCSSTFQCIFYEGHAVCCRCCCSGEGPARHKTREEKKKKKKKKPKTLPR